MPDTPESSSPTRIIAVGGGKGGVGKSLICANLCVAMAQAGQKVVLIDGDLGAANLHTMFGLVRSEKTILDFLSRGVEDLAETQVATEVPNLSLIPGAGAVPGVANINFGQKQRLLRHIRGLKTDVVVVDVGAGTSFNVVDLFDVADFRLVVVTPQVPAMVNAYAFIKAAVYRVITKILKQAKQEQVLASGLSAAETERVGELLNRVSQKDAALAVRIQASLDHFGARVIGNMVYVDKDLRQIHAISRMSKDFLCLDVPVIGHLMKSELINNSISKRKPYLIEGGADGNAPALRRIAERLLNEDAKTLRKRRTWSEEVLEVSAPRPSEPVESAQEVESYVHRADRHEVEWTATLIWPGGVSQVRVRDVSMDGALVEGTCDLAVGTKGTMIFDELPGQPLLEVEVRNVQANSEQFGLMFLGGSEAPAQVVEAARGGR
ncbi:MAG: AAA family ATPase [Pseudomonadota bacterium]